MRPVSSSWPPPNYINPVTHGPGLLAVQVTLLPIVLVCLALRLYARVGVKGRPVGLDDWLMVFATICTTALAILIILANQRYGWNLHIWDQTADQLVESRKADIAAQTVFLVADGLAKTSILASYLRMAPRKSWLQRGTLATMVIVGSTMVVLEVVVWTQCFPASSYWDLSSPSTSCTAPGPPLLAQTITTVLTSTMVLLLPVRALLHLPLPPSQRLGLLCVYLLACLALAAACLRSYFATLTTTSPAGDTTWYTFDAHLSAITSLNLLLIASNIPLLRPLFTCELLTPVEERSYWPGTPKRRGRSLSRSRRAHMQREREDLEAGFVTVQENRPWRKGSRETIFTLETLTVSRGSSTRTVAEGHAEGRDSEDTVVGGDSSSTHDREKGKRDAVGSEFVKKGDVRRTPTVSEFEVEVHTPTRGRYSMMDSESGISAVLEIGTELAVPENVERGRGRMSRMEIENGVRNFGRMGVRLNSPLIESFERGLGEGLPGQAR